LKTLGERIKYLQKNSGKNQVEFAKSLGVSKGSLILYQKNDRSPGSSFLRTLCELYQVNPTWLLLGEGEPALEEEGKVAFRTAKDEPIDPVVLLINEEEERAGITLSPEQRKAIQKILRDLVDRDIGSIRELLGSMKVNTKREIK